jgi:hypothetical protein
MSGKSWDKLILLAVGLVVTAVSVVFSLGAMSFSEKFVMRPASPDDTLPETQEAVAKAANSFVEKNQSWTNPTKGAAPKPVPLFVSIPIVEARGILIDMLDPNAPRLREPVTNAWLMSNNLDYLNAGVLNQDSDGDGFTNLAEWDAKTDPNDPKSHPPYAEKLIFASRQQEVYMLKFAARPDPERFQIARIPTAKWPQRDTFLLRVGEVSKDQQFRVESFEEKSSVKNGITVDASEITVTFLPKNERHILVRNVDTPIPTYYAEMKFELDESFQQYVKEGETFNLVIDPDTKYRVVKVEENSVTINYQTGTEPEVSVEIPKK